MERPLPKLGNRLSCFLFALLVGIPTIVGYFGLFMCPAGAQLLFRTEARLRSGMVATPLDDRGLFWHVRDSLIKVHLQLPLFILASGGDRLTMYRSMHESNGDITPFSGGIAVHTYRGVADVIRSNNQPRGFYLGAMPVPERCMGRSTLIYVSTGEAHAKARQFLLRNLRGLSHWSSELLPEPLAVGDFTQADEKWIKRAIARNLWFNLFGEKPDQELETNLYSYWSWGGTCVLGATFDKLTLGYFSKKVLNIRTKVYAAALATQVGKELHKTAVTKDGYSKAESDAMLMQLVDGFMFAGLLGTGHLVTHTLERIRQSPAIYVPMWHKNPKSFLLESARVDPPVTSVTAVLGEEQELSIASGWGGTGFLKTRVPNGSTVQLVISEANVDPSVFGGSGKTVQRALEFDPLGRSEQELNQILSWNGVHEQVTKGTAPRGCLGYHVSFDIATKIISRFLPVEAEAWAAHRKAKDDMGGVDSAFGFDASVLNVHVAYGMWLIASVIALLVIKFGRSNRISLSSSDYGPMSSWYAMFLLAQIMLSLGTLTGYSSLVDHSLIQVGHAYYRCVIVTLTYRSMRRGKGTWVFPDVNERLPGVDLTVCSTVVMHCLLVAIHCGVGTGSQVPFTSAMCGVFISFGTLGAFASVTYFWITEADAHAKSAMLFGLVGGVVGLLGFVWPAFVLQGRYFALLPALVNIHIFTPLAVSAVMEIDNRIIQGPPEVQHTDHQMKAHKPDIARQRKGLSLVRRALAAFFVLLVAVVAQPFLADIVRGGQLCFYADEFAASKELCTKGAKYLDQVDYHTRTLYRVLRNFASNKNQTRPDGSAVKVPTEMYGNRPWKNLFFDIVIPVWDEDTPSNWFKELLSTTVFDYLRSGWINCLKDVHVEYKSSEEAHQMFQIAASDDLKPLELTPWKELWSDEAVSRFSFAGLAAHRMEAVSGAGFGIAYKCDWDWLSNYEVRAGFERYGAIAYFDSRANLKKIYWSHAAKFVHPGEADWEHAKWAYKSTVVAGATLKDHLVGIHFMISNFLTSSSVTNLGANHSIRRLLKPHTYGAVSINMGATKTLATEFSLLHRASSFHWTEIEKAFYDCVALNRFVPLMVQLKASGMDRVPSSIYPFGEDLKAFVSVVGKFVHSYVSLYYGDDGVALRDSELNKFWAGLKAVPHTGIPPNPSKANLILVLTELIVHTTAIHNAVGNVADYLVDPRFVSTKIRPGKEIADVQASFQGLAIGLMTANLQPHLINNFTHLVLPGDHQREAVALFNQFQSDLDALSKTIDRKNKQRRFPCNAFNPRTMVSSVSI